MSKVNILYAIDSLRRGGAERQFVQMLRGMDRNVVKINVVYFVEDDSSYISDLHDVGIFPVFIKKSGRWGVLKSIKSVISFVSKNDIKIVHSMLNYSGVVCGVASVICRVKHVCSVIREAKDPNYKYYFIRKVLAYFCDVYVANSVAGFNARFSNWKNNFRVVYNGYDFSEFPDYSLITPNSNDLFSVAMCASFSDYKDQLTAVKAIEYLVENFESYSRWKLYLAGDGPTKKSLEEYVASKNLDDNVEFVGVLKEPIKLFSKVDVVLMLTNTNVHQEGISNSIIEAMACGMPVIATNGGGTPEFIKNWNNGILVENNDFVECANSIFKLFKNKELMEFIGYNARKTVLNMFGLDRMVNEYIFIYKELFGSHDK